MSIPPPTAHWSADYLGREWSAEHDCAEFVRTVLEDRFGIEVRLPSGFDWRRTDPQQVHDLSGAFARKVEKRFESCGILMKMRGNRRSLGSHIGLFVEIAGKEYCLHCTEGMGSHLTPIERLPDLQYEVVGYYRWMTGHAA